MRPFFCKQDYFFKLFVLKDLKQLKLSMDNKNKLILAVEYKLLQQYSKNDWNFLARDNQQIPQGDWKIWIILAGRGFGKTRTGAEAVKFFVNNGYNNICLLGETIHEVRSVMLEGKSGLLNIYDKYGQPKFYPSRNLLVWNNGAIGSVMSAENPQSLRGPQFDLAWIDELAKFDKVNECWDQLMMTMRLGIPKIIITTTPRPIGLIKKIMTMDGVIITTGNTYQNQDNLSPHFLETIKNEYENTSFGAQEIHGEILSENHEELWSYDIIQYTDNIPINLDIIISIDPAMTNNSNSDQTGILIIGSSNDGNYYVIEDLTCNEHINLWMNMVVRMYYKYSAIKIIIEVNQGGDLFKESFLNIDDNLYIEEVRASKNKYIRAQPVSLLYQKRCVYHTKIFYELENQMTRFSELISQNKSPDRVDALVWGILNLKNNNKFKIL